jgi:hypothetical protein
MMEMLAIVQLETGLVVDLPNDTPTFDVPPGFDPAGTSPLGTRAWRVLARRAAGEEFLVKEGGAVLTGPPRWFLSTREPVLGGEA